MAFANWCVDVKRLPCNNLDGLGQIDESDARKRRALTEDELIRLLAVARDRPLIDAMTVRRGKRKGERYGKVHPEIARRREELGRERALIYKTLILTGLRKNELASLTVAQVALDGKIPYIDLDAADEKNREGNGIVFRDDLAADVADWLARKLESAREAARETGLPIPAKLDPAAPLFCVPDKLSKILNRDLRMAGIPKADDRGRTVDVHALRTTFGTLLSAGGVAPRVAQEAMRHKRIEMTMKVYTDPRLLNVQGALDTLPQLPLDSSYSEPEQQQALATGTHGPSPVAPNIAPDSAQPCHRVTCDDKNKAGLPTSVEKARLEFSRLNDRLCDDLTVADKACEGVGDTRLELVTPSVSSWCSSQLS